MEMYYQYEVNAEGVIVAISSSETPFTERQLTSEQLKLVKVGRTKENELQ